MEILLLIDRLESLVGASQRLPLARRRMVEETALLDLIDQLRVAIPDDVREAQRVLEEREALLDGAQQEAARLVAEAETESRRRLDESKLLSEAEERAGQLLEEAREEAERLLAEAEEKALQVKADADEYSLQVLRNLHNQLLEFSTSVRRGVELLERDESQG